MATAQDEARPIGAKLLWRLVAPITFLTLLSSLDRANVSFAALRMNADIGLTPEMYGIGVGTFFFLGFIGFQFPHALSQRLLGARIWITTWVTLWGLAATAMTFVNTPTEFYVLRFVLGVCESGWAPGIIYYMSQWAPRRFRASSIAGSMLAIPLSIIIGGPLSGLLMTIQNPVGIEGWRFMFFVEGAATVLCGIGAYFYFRNTMEEAGWLNDSERAWIRAELARDAASAPPEQAANFGAVLTSPRIWAAAGVWFTLLSGAYAIMFWLPQVIRALAGGNDLEVSVLSALPWVGVGAGMMLNSWHSDKTQERYWHIGLAAVLAAGALVAAALAGPTPAALMLLVLAGLGLGGAQGAYWALPTSFMTGGAAAAGVALINTVGSSGGVVTPPLIGWILQGNESIQAPIFTVAGFMVTGIVLLLIVRALEPRGGPPAAEAVRAH